ncbi:hypothetical protein GALMADRAFT_73686 [Galerina marginata CBS 339.88]|uniref:Integrase core domain-containing protein n=1 Tax=Galerina marginata (strain CBS 339.88) TaxID=685588 RepID=A0A067SP35_GALM3|nr:hypothetical protein GALMADRAFT_73686 [Galerina marginata CBS 339.88]
METRFGVERGSYIWGRSVHNIRIERLWCDVTRGFGLKWHNFFLELEFACGLNPNLEAHIWLLHFLFLKTIHEDAEDWANVWNNHKLRFDRERTRSPRDMFFFGMIQNGPRGLSVHNQPLNDEPIEDLAHYGVDWEDLDDPNILEHHERFNPDDFDDSNHPFDTHAPNQLSHVEIPKVSCPFDDETLEIFNTQISSLPFFASRNMISCRNLWIHALALCRQLQ